MAGLIYPGVKAGMRSAEKTRAASTAYSIKNSIGSYYTEYRKFPVPETETMEGGYLTDETIMNVLVSGPTDLNPRKIVFYSGRVAKPVGGDAAGKEFRFGISEEAGNFKLWDPWGNQYRIGLDLDGDGKVKGPSGAEIQDSVIVWSPGPDGTDATDDDIATW
jgi:hypothetical protein